MKILISIYSLALGILILPSGLAYAETSEPSPVTQKRIGDLGRPPVREVHPNPSSLGTSGKIKFDAWYTITISPSIHYGYYNDRLEDRKGKLYFQNRVWKKEENYLNEEQLGALAKDNPDLTPIFFNFHSIYRTTETHIDGSFQSGKTLSVKVKKGAEELPLIKKILPSKTMLSVFFPVWLGKRISHLKPGAQLSFMAVLEDNIELAFSPVTGSLTVEKSDDFATQTKTRKINLSYGDRRSTWWVDHQGVALKIDMKDQKAIVEKVTKEKAESFLTE